MKKELIVQRDPKSPISEIFRTLRTNIQFMNTTNKLKTLLITSTLPGEGKSYVSSNLAVTFAQAGKKVILIDADMRKGRLYSIFDISPRPGLSNYLSGIDLEEGEEKDITEYIQTTSISNLLVIPAGNIPPNPSELLISPQMNHLLEELKEVCDIIIIDGTPCELVTDSVILSRIVDSTVIVSAVKETKKDNLARVIANIQNVGGKLAGVVVNKVPISAKKYGEKYYYGSTSTKKVNKKTIIAMDRRRQLKSRTSDTISQNIRRNNTETVRREQEKNLKSNNEDIKKANINETMERPKSINKSRTTGPAKNADDILKQINTYLENEKKNLN